MKRLLSVALAAAVGLMSVSCGKDDDPMTPCPTEPNTITGLIKTDQTWTADKEYTLCGRVIVTSGVTLTIEPGTIIKGREGTGSSASVLIIARGGKIMAEGTADKPIIFTSVLDDIKVGKKLGLSLKKTDNENWGGLIILGNAPISAKEGDNEASIEGIPADEEFSKYGGNEPNDNSGVLKYVSIRHGGSLIGDGNEINGLTLGGVGRGTTIENIEVFATLDDGVEFFGGTVNAKNILVYWQGDDGLDIDQNYSGTVTNFIVSHGEGVDTDEGLEIDGPESTLKGGKFKLINGTLINDGVEGSAADVKADAQGSFENVVFRGYKDGATLKFEAEYTFGDCTDHENKEYTDALQNLLARDISFTKTKFDKVEVYSKQTKEDDGKTTKNCANIPATDQNAAQKAVGASDANATGADASEFDWTAAVQRAGAKF